ECVFEITDVTLVVRIDTRLNEIDQRTRRWRRRTPALYGSAFRSGSLGYSSTSRDRDHESREQNQCPHENLLNEFFADRSRHSDSPIRFFSSALAFSHYDAASRRVYLAPR